MRKLGFSLFSCIALVAFMGLSATALAAVDPSCDGDPYNNDPVVHDFSIVTPNSSMEHAVSAVEGAGLACGTDVSVFSTGTVYDHADVKNPAGVEVNGTAGIATGRFIGIAVVNVASQYLGIVQDNASILRTEPIADCQAETPVGGQTPGAIIACYRGSTPVGFNRNWTTVDSDGRTSMTIGPFHTTGIAGLTNIKQFNLCGNVGSTSGTSYPADCGNSSQPFVQKNGDDSVPKCKNGDGSYAVTATMRNGFTTPPATSCTKWLSIRSQHNMVPRKVPIGG